MKKKILEGPVVPFLLGVAIVLYLAFCLKTAVAMEWLINV
jgi:hypothetical protein